MKLEFYNLKAYLFSFLLISVFSCNRNSRNSDIDIDAIDYYILEYSNYKETPLDHDVFPSEYKAYNLSKEDIIKCEKLLKKQIEEVFNTNSKTKIILKNYSRQYIGAEDPNGHKVAFINLFCNPEEFTKKERFLVVVYGGGLCYFNLKIDLTENIIIDFITNGLS